MITRQDIVSDDAIDNINKRMIHLQIKRRTMVDMAANMHNSSIAIILESNSIGKYTFIDKDSEEPFFTIFTFNSNPNYPNVLECKDKMINEI